LIDRPEKDMIIYVKAVAPAEIAGEKLGVKRRPAMCPEPLFEQRVHSHEERVEKTRISHYFSNHPGGVRVEALFFPAHYRRERETRNMFHRGNEM
jgi:hypothetical protein